MAAADASSSVSNAAAASASASAAAAAPVLRSMGAMLGSQGKALIGMVHVRPLPGTPRWDGGPLQAVIETAVREAALLEQLGCDAVLTENMHDVPYLLGNVGPEIVAAMTAVGRAIRAETTLPLGVQILAGANRAALAVAVACEAAFIRAEGFVFAAVADEGLMAEADAGPLLRYRRQIGAEHIAIFADVQKKHSSHALTADLDIAGWARAAAFAGADGIIITGSETAAPVATADLQAAREEVDQPIIVGSGAQPQTVATLLEHADAIIAGSCLKQGGRWDQPIDAEAVKRMVAAVRAAAG